MVDNYCLESADQKIYNQTTKKQFEEVIKSYNSQNYRSATVILWSVLVCDLVYKLQELETIYQDAKATSILEYIAEEQTSRPTASDWEIEIFKKAQKSTGLISAKFLLDLEYLQKNRHCCAHPLMNSDYKLYIPTKDMVRAFIRTALEELLTKSPIMQKNSFAPFLIDANNIYSRMEYETEKYFRYLDDKYFNRLDNAGIQYYFKTLWKFVFLLENDECKENRESNLLILIHIFKNHDESLLGLIKSDISYFSNLNPEESVQKLFIEFLSQFPAIFNNLNDAARSQVEICVNTYANSFIISWFLSKNLKEHISVFKEKYHELASDISIDHYKMFWEKCCDYDLKTSAIDISIWMITFSTSYTETKIVFENTIRDYLNEYNLTQITQLIEGVNSNDQVFGYAKSRSYFTLIKERCNQLDTNFDYSTFPNFLSDV